MARRPDRSSNKTANRPLLWKTSWTRRQKPPAPRSAKDGWRTRLGLIKEKAAKHPEWPPAHVILAKLLLQANQTPQARRALEQAASLAPDHPDVYLLLGMLAMADGRLSDARLNFENVLGLAGTGHWDAEKTHIFAVRA